jgi:hypothetical protein
MKQDQAASPVPSESTTVSLSIRRLNARVTTPADRVSLSTAGSCGIFGASNASRRTAASATIGSSWPTRRAMSTACDDERISSCSTGDSEGRSADDARALAMKLS